jgi:hypothetical protein
LTPYRADHFVGRCRGRAAGDNLAGYSWERRNNVIRSDAQVGVSPILGFE